MRNFTQYPDIYRNMNVKDLEVGQTLLRLYEGRYDSMPHKIIEYKITKILKTRIVLADPNIPDNEVRILVNGANSYPAGEVQTKREGDTSFYDPAYKFTTEDERPLLEKIVARRQKSVDFIKVKGTARAAVADYKEYDLESIDAAILALQALRDAVSEDNE
jgi:hypothetical protein